MVPGVGDFVELLHANRAAIDLGFNGRHELIWQTKMGAALSSVVDRVFQSRSLAVLRKVGAAAASPTGLSM